MTEAIAGASALILHAWTFFVRHYLIVLAFGVFASAQRFFSVGDFDVPLVDGVVGEIFTMTVRVAFVIWVVWVVLRDRPELSAQHSTVGVILVSTGYLLLISLVFKVGFDIVGGQFIPERHQSTYFAWELAIKNLTVIPFTMVWMVVLIVTLVGSNRDSIDVSERAQAATLNPPSASGPAHSSDR